jgi:predicted metal-dependent phosphoesterase TrpH
MSLLRFDLHVHSRSSRDCLMAPARIREAAIRRGLAGVAITDHDVFTKVPNDGSPFVFVAAEEIKTKDRGDIIGLFLKEEVKPAPMRHVLAEIHSQGALAIVPHPFDSLGRRAVRPRLEEAHEFDAIEIFNSRCVRKEDNRKALRFAFDCQRPAVGGSDAHFYSEIGNAVTLAEIPTGAKAKERLALLKKAISEGKTSAALVRSAPLVTRLGTSVTKLRKRLGV